MNVVASFKLNRNLESAIAELEHFGISRKKILALPLETIAEREMIVSRKKALFETAPIIGTIFMLLGAIYGFILYGGPIIWGLIGLVSGMVVGLMIDLFRVRRNKQNEKYEEGKLPEVFLLVHCYDKDQALYVKEKLWKHSPIGVSSYIVDPDGGGDR